MDSEDLNRKDAFFDRMAFDRLAQVAKQRRARFLEKSPRSTFALLGSIALICGAGLLIGIGSRDSLTKNEMASVGYDSEARVTAATDQIERFRSALESASALSPQTAREIEQQIGRPDYDCNRTPCSALLQHRNYVARSQLKALLAQKTLPDRSGKAVARVIR